MVAKIKLPDMGTNVEECKVLSWLVEEGAAVKRGQALAEIETDKAVAELESTAEGVMLRHRVKAGEMVRTGDVLAYVGQPGEPIPEEPPAGATVTMAAREAAATSSPEKSAAPARISPLVRNLAAKLGVDLATVQGTGAGGMITREDVLRASRAAPVAQEGRESETLSRAQAAVARAVTRSWREIPHLSITAAIDMSAAQALREQSKARGEPISYDVLFLKAMVLAAKSVPLMVARLEGEQVTKRPNVHLAFAVGFGNELLLPVVREVERKDLPALQAEVTELADRARARTLKPEQLTGAAMALSNLGMYPIEAFDAIIFPEHSAMLTVGSVQLKPVAWEGKLEVRPVATAKLAADHRLINGRTAAEFLTKIKEIMEAGNFS